MKLVTLDALRTFKTKLDGLFVAKELKTGSDSEYRTLTDNNLTDELVEKINASGAAAEVTEEIGAAKNEAVTESNAYTDNALALFTTNITDQLQLELNGVKDRLDGEMATDEEVNIAIQSVQSNLEMQLNTLTMDMATNAGVASKIEEAKYYADAAEADAVATSKAYADEQLAAAKTELQADINAKISTAYKVKGSSAFADLPAPSETEEGNVYNITDAFTTTDVFVEGAGKKYPAGTNVVCIEDSEGSFMYDILPGFIDTDTFVKNDDIETISEAEIDELFTA